MSPLPVFNRLNPPLHLTGMAELASLVQRLELAVGRLEAMSGPGGSTGDSAGGGNHQVSSLWNNCNKRHTNKTSGDGISE